MLAYLAGPIDAVGDDVGLRQLRQSAWRELAQVGFAVYDPAQRPFHNAPGDPQACYDINEYALERSSAVLALLPPGRTTVGTPMEIQSAARAGKAVAAVVGEKWSMQLAGLGVKTFTGAEAIVEAVAYLKAESGLGLSPISLAIKHMMNRYPLTTATDGGGVKYLGGSEGAGTPPRPELQLRWAGDPDCAPVAGYPGDAGWDLVVSEDTRIPVDGFADVPCGIRVQLPEGYWARITGRSSTIRKRSLHVAEGIIDNGYRGELFCAAWNLGERVATIKRGERIAQLILHQLDREGIELVEADELEASIRGENGFGSTGT